MARTLVDAREEKDSDRQAVYLRPPPQHVHSYFQYFIYSHRRPLLNESLAVHSCRFFTLGVCRLTRDTALSPCNFKSAVV
jgi:hypothetical protein